MKTFLNKAPGESMVIFTPFLLSSRRNNTSYQCNIIGSIYFNLHQSVGSLVVIMKVYGLEGQGIGFPFLAKAKYFYLSRTNKAGPDVYPASYEMCTD
jgi:hypothetical protein